MSARAAEISRIKSPIKKEIKHLAGKTEKEFPELLEKIVVKLRENGFKLFHVTKSYRKKDTIRSDNFWKKESRVKNIKIVWLCKLTIIFDNGIDFKFDFDYWFKFSKFRQTLRGKIYDLGFPYTKRSYAKKFGKKEATRALDKIENRINEKLKRKSEGWGVHGIKKEVSNRKSSNICHKKEFKISSIPELDKLRKSIDGIIEDPMKIIEENRDKIEKIANKKIKDLFPFDIKADSLEGYLALFLWFRDPGGGFEFQAYRFVQENFGEVVKKEDIRDALLRLEVHNYANVKETPKELRDELNKQDIKRNSRFYETGKRKIHGKKIHKKLNFQPDLGAYLYPLSRKKLVKKVNAPNHLVNKKIKELTRKNFLSKNRVKDFRGRTVKKIKPKRNLKNPSKLERKIMKLIKNHYDKQKQSLDKIQKRRP